MRQPLDDGRLADARLADQHRIIFAPPRQHLDHAANLRIAADHRVDLALPGQLDQVGRVTLQCLVFVLGVLIGHLLSAAHRFEGGQKIGFANAVEIEQTLRLFARVGQCQQQVLG